MGERKQRKRAETGKERAERVGRILSSNPSFLLIERRRGEKGRRFGVCIKALPHCSSG